MAELTIPVCQWWQNGDHPEDESRLADGSPRSGNPSGQLLTEGKVVRRWRRPDVDGSARHGACGRHMDDHGFIDVAADGRTVCPGDLIVTIRGRYYPMRPYGGFPAEPVEDPAGLLGDLLGRLISANGMFE